MKKRILLLAQRPSDYVEIKRIVDALHANQEFDMFILYASNIYDEHHEVLASLNQLKLKGKIFEYLCYRPADGFFSWLLRRRRRKPKLDNAIDIHDIELRNNKKKARSRLIKALSYAILLLLRALRNIRKLFVSLCKLAIMFELYLTSYLFFKKVIKENNISFVIMPEDVVGMVTPLLVKAARKQSVPSVIIPYTIANQEEAFNSLKGNENYSLDKKANAIAGKIFKKWAMREDNISLLRLPAIYVLMHELTRTSPPKPWLLHSGYADVICVENQKMYDYYIQSGLPEKQLAVVGAFYDDVLAENLMNKKHRRKQFLSELGLCASKPILLVGGCPNQFANCPDGVEFDDMDEAAAFLVEALMPLSDRFNIIVRPHPNFYELGELLQHHESFFVSRLDTAVLISWADVYIAFASATIRWAISCGVPTINYDLFQYDYSDYRGVPGVLNVRHKEAFLNALLVISDAEQLAALQVDLSHEKSKWGMLDGKSGQRIEKLINMLIEHKSYEKVRRLAYEVV